MNGGRKVIGLISSERDEAFVITSLQLFRQRNKNINLRRLFWDLGTKELYWNMVIIFITQSLHYRNNMLTQASRKDSNGFITVVPIGRAPLQAGAQCEQQENNYKLKHRKAVAVRVVTPMAPAGVEAML